MAAQAVGLRRPRPHLLLPGTHLSALPAGCSRTDLDQTLEAPRPGAWREEARGSYDHVVPDTPPIVPVPDTRLLREWVDAFLLVVAAHVTPREPVAGALDLVEPAKVGLMRSWQR